VEHALRLAASATSWATGLYHGRFPAGRRGHDRRGWRRAPRPRTTWRSTMTTPVGSTSRP